MGNSICYFVDTDLCGMCPDVFHRTLKKRCGCPIIIRKNRNTDCDDSAGEWSYWCQDRDFGLLVREGGLELYRDGDGIYLEMGFWTNTFDIPEFVVDGEELYLSNDRFFTFISDSSRDTRNTLHRLRIYIDALKKYVQPVVNCHRLFLCGDQVYDEKRESWQSHLLEGMSIDDALRLNSSSPNPEPVFTWNNLAALVEKDIDDSAIFVFDIDNLPDYLQ